MINYNMLQRKVFFLIPFLTMVAVAKGAFAIELNEGKLKELLEKSAPPALLKIEVAKTGEDIKFTSFYELYGPSLFYQGEYSDKAFRNRSGFSSVYDGVQTYHQVGIKQKLPYGTDLEFSVKQNSARTNLSGAFPGLGTQMGGARKEVTSAVELKGQMDLWKNFLGKIDQAQLNSSDKGKKIGELKELIEKQRFKTQLRKIYWRLVANNQSVEISQKLLKTSQVNSANVVARHQESLADSGDVSRSSAAVSMRKGALLSLDFEKENLLLALKNLLPALTNEEVQLTQIDFDDYINQVMVCIGTISNNQEAPLDATYFKEISTILNEQLRDEIIIEESHDKMDLKLVGSIYRDGQGDNNQSSMKDFNKKERTDYSVGLMVQIPLDGRKNSSKEKRTLLKKLMFEGESLEFENQLKTTHSFISNSIQILVKAMQEQKMAKHNLDNRLDSMRNKYRQGRISISELMADEDQLIDAELSIVKTQLLIVETILSYFDVFNKLDCPFNKF